jgi:tetratricopeptide (TPR) repeat protein
MLADMLSLNGKLAEALTEYRKSLASDPNRFNSLLGAGQAAEQLGERRLALGYYRTLLANCTCASEEAVPALRHAQSFIKEYVLKSTNETHDNVRRWSHF